LQNVTHMIQYARYLSSLSIGKKVANSARKTDIKSVFEPLNLILLVFMALLTFLFKSRLKVFR